jgi:hypothetical protein
LSASEFGRGLGPPEAGPAGRVRSSPLPGRTQSTVPFQNLLALENHGASRLTCLRELQRIYKGRWGCCARRAFQMENRQRLPRECVVGLE